MSQNYFEKLYGKKRRGFALWAQFPAHGWVQMATAIPLHSDALALARGLPADCVGYEVTPAGGQPNGPDMSVEF